MSPLLRGHSLITHALINVRFWPRIQLSNVSQAELDAVARKLIEPAYVTFALDAEGKVARMTMKPVSPLADFSYDYQDLLFTPQRDD